MCVILKNGGHLIPYQVNWQQVVINVIGYKNTVTGRLSLLGDIIKSVWANSSTIS